MSMWTITTKGVDILLAMLLGLRYRQLVTLRRVCVIAVFFWVCPRIVRSKLGILSPFSWKIWSTTSTALCLITLIFCYRIFVNFVPNRCKSMIIIGSKRIDQFYRKIHCLTSEFHVKFHAKNRYRTNREAMSAISGFQVKFDVEFTSQAVNFS